MWRCLKLLRRQPEPQLSEPKPPFAFAEDPYVLLYRNQFGWLIVAPGSDNFTNLDDATSAARQLCDDLQTSIYVMRTVRTIVYSPTVTAMEARGEWMSGGISW